MLLIFMHMLTAGKGQVGEGILLNGKWEVGYHRQYKDYAIVPGLVTDPAKINTDTIWLRRSVSLPTSNWSNAALELKGARFCPSVYIDGDLVSKSEGGMAPIYKPMTHLALKPGKHITLEIALLPLDKMKADDASRIPAADLWRSNVSSCLWDDVVLHLYKQSYIKSIVPQADFNAGSAIIHYELGADDNPTGEQMDIAISDFTGKVLLHESYVLNAGKGKFVIPLHQKLKAWSPEAPVLYKLSATLKAGLIVYDKRTLNYGYKQFKVAGLQFTLNNKPIRLHAASVVWHRWVRDPEAKELAWDEKWFEKNIVKRLKDLGANTLRFHLGLPPERLLDLCDRYGLMVQAEWSFFHGMKASEQSLLEQWPAWFNASLKHPSVVLLHGWNETEGKDELELAFKAINEVAKEYEPVVLGHRDVIHVHKYWWSLFENLGLYYDSYKQFPKPIMVDEFGGNYLDEKGNIGKYPTTAASYKRFLGKTTTVEERLHFQAISNSKVAEYWRRIGAAGFSPFVALSSPEDGNTWFIGPLNNGAPKPVWNSLSVAYAPVSVSLNVWDKHFEPGGKISVESHIFNDTEKRIDVGARMKLSDRITGEVISEVRLDTALPAHTQANKLITVALPTKAGSWKFALELDSTFNKTKYPVASEWNFETFNPIVSTKVSSSTIGVADTDDIAKAMLRQLGIKQTGLSDIEADILLVSGKSLNSVNPANQIIPVLENALNKGKHVILLDAGLQLLGQGYKNDLNSLQSAPEITSGATSTIALPFNIKASFKEVAEPESHIQYAADDSSLWKNLQKNSTWLWNGYRGGLIVPAVDMELTGLNADSYLRNWKSKGADEALIKAGNYYSYELQGFYDYSQQPADKKTEERLRNKVRFLVEDAPALKTRINPEALILSTNLSNDYQQSIKGKVEQLQPLVSAGKDLLRAPVTLLTFKDIKGKLIISQLLTDGRLSKADVSPIGYEVRYDPVAVQFVLNMMEKVLDK